MVLFEGKVVWNGQLWCFRGFCLHFGSFADTFFWHFIFPRHMHGDFEILGWKHLAGSNAVAELDQFFQRGLRLVVLGFYVAKSLPDTLQKSLKISVIFKKSEKILKSRFPHSKNGKIWDFLKLGQRPLEGSQMVLVAGKVVWNGQSWCLEESWVHFGWHNAWWTYVLVPIDLA